MLLIRWRDPLVLRAKTHGVKMQCAEPTGVERVHAKSHRAETIFTVMAEDTMLVMDT